MAIIKNSITFGSGFNITAQGPIDSRMVVEYIKDLTTVWDSNAPAYEGMMVSVIEDGNIYVLKNMNTSDSDETTYNWKKVSEDVDIEGLKTSAKKLSSPITVAGLSDSFGNVDNGKQYTTEHSVEDILRDLLCKEIYPSVSLSTTNPTLSFGGLVGATAIDYKSIMEVGSVLKLNPVTLSSADITSCYRVGTGFTYGYSSANDNSKDGDGNPPIENGSSSLVDSDSYTLTETYSPSSIGTPRKVSPSNNCDDVKFDEEGSVKIALGSNVITISATSPSGIYTHPEYPEYYIVSNLGNTSDDNDKKLSKSSETSGNISSVTKSETISVTGVYPVYVNISSGGFVDEPLKMSLTTSSIFEFNVPSEVASDIHFTFDYPSTHSVTSFKVKDLSGNFVDYSATYEKESKIVTKVIGGNNVDYKRFVTTGKLQGEGIYKITLSKGLDK